MGTTVLKTPATVADWGQLARGTGFAQAPGIFRVFFFVPVVGPLIGLVALIWQIACMIIAVRQCLDYTSTWRAFFVVLISLIPYAMLYIIADILAWRIKGGRKLAGRGPSPGVGVGCRGP